MIQAAESARMKVRRASKNAKTINRLCARYGKSTPFAVVSDAAGRSRLQIVREPPVEIALLIGEMAYQLRSSLDHLFFDLVAANHAGGTLPKNWEGTCQFPILSKSPNGGRLPIERRHLSASCVALTDRAFQFIESIQPYHNHDAGDLLRCLGTISNIDKHRRLNTTVALVTSYDRLTTPEGYTSTSMSARVGHGMELPAARHPPEMVARATTKRSEWRPEIAFDEPSLGPRETWPIHVFVDFVPTFMRHYVVPNLEELCRRP